MLISVSFFNIQQNKEDYKNKKPVSHKLCPKNVYTCRQPAPWSRCGEACPPGDTP